MPRTQSNEREHFWRRHITNSALSGLTIRAYCQRHGLGEHSFYSWRRTIAQRDRRVKSAPDESITPPAFVPVAVVAGPSRLPDSAIEIRLVDGRRVRVRAGCDRALLADVLDILHATPPSEARPC